jgi:hypothetical protein
MSELTKDLIQAALDQDYNKASQVFGDIMGVKMNDVLDQEKIKLAGQIYNGEEPEEDDTELEDADFEDIEDDTDGEDEVEESEDEDEEESEDVSDDEEE